MNPVPFSTPGPDRNPASASLSGPVPEIHPDPASDPDPTQKLPALKTLVRNLPSLFKETAREWQEDNAMRLAAALSYYTVFSLAPLVLAAIGIAGLVFGHEAATGKIHAELQGVTGPTVAASVQEMVKAADKPATGLLSAIRGFALGLFGASGVFGELMGSLNQIWGVTEKAGGGIWVWIKGRFLSIGMVMGVCFLLLVSLLASAALTKATDYGLRHLPSSAFIAQVINVVLSFGLITVLFAAMFKFLPKTRIEWRDVWVGAAVTAALFSIGKIGLEQYLARSNPGSSYGAAGALALLLIWVYYSAQIFFFGAEFTEVYARRLGSRHAFPPPPKPRIAAPGTMVDSASPGHPCPAPASGFALGSMGSNVGAAALSTSNTGPASGPASPPAPVSIPWLIAAGVVVALRKRPGKLK